MIKRKFYKLFPSFSLISLKYFLYPSLLGVNSYELPLLEEGVHAVLCHFITSY